MLAQTLNLLHTQIEESLQRLTHKGLPLSAFPSHRAHALGYKASIQICFKFQLLKIRQSVLVRCDELTLATNRCGDSLRATCLRENA